ncbi:MAG: lysostaphin resistance A-like protein [Leptolyngbyaceae cyanobacterium]
MAANIRVLTAIFLFFLGWISLWAIVMLPLFKRFQWRPFQPTPPEQKLALLMPLYVLAPAAIFISNQISGQSWQQLGLIWSLANAYAFGLGWVIAIAGLVLVLIAKSRCGLIKFQTESAPTTQGQGSLNQLLTIIGLVLIGIWIGSIEEIIFRGWLQTQLQWVFAPVLALGIGSLMFAVAHLIWDGRAGLWQQPGLWLLGAVLVTARWAQGDAIALASGLHAGWVTGLAYVGELLRPLPVAGKPTVLTGRSEQPLTDVWDFSLLLGTGLLINTLPLISRLG